MRPPLKLSFTILLVASASAAMTPNEFIQDSQVKSLAPNLVDEIITQGLNHYSDIPQNPPSDSGFELPLLKNIVQVVSLNIFNAGDADWSKLEQAKLKATREHGADAIAMATNLTEVDARKATLIVDTIYDTVINLPPPSKESYKAMKESAESKEKVDREHKEGADEETNKKADAPSSMWDYLGIGLIKSSNTVKKVQGIVSPSNVCETTDTGYLQGVVDVIYYSSLTHGFAGGALLSAPDNSPVKSPDLQMIVSAIGKLAIEIHMAQNVARLADLSPADSPVRIMTYLALTSDSSTSPSAQMARDIHNLVSQRIADNIPTAVLRSLADQASLQLVNDGARSGLGSGSGIFNNIPVVRDVLAFSTEVLDANSIGAVLKYVFCPEASSPTMTEKVVEKIKEGAEDAAEKGSGAAQKVFKASEDTAKNVVEEVKKRGQDAKAKVGETAENVAEEVKGVKDETVAKASEAGSNIKYKAEGVGAKVQEKVLEGTEKVNEKGEQMVQDAKDTAAEVKKKAEGSVEAAKEKVKEEQEAAKKKAQEMREAAGKKGEEVKQKAEEVKQKVVKKEEEVKHKATEKGEEAKHKAEEVKNKAAEKGEEAKHKAEEVKQKVAKKGEEAKQKAAEKVDEVKQEL